MAAVKEQSPSPEPQSYIWSFPGAPVRIHLALEVVQLLAPRFQGKEGATQFGLLLGHVDGLAIVVSDFQVLASSETLAVKTALARLSASSGRPAVVGYYRSQRQEGLRLDDQDLALAESFFRAPSDIILLVQAGPAPANATFFFRDGGRLNGDFPFLEFPFDPRQLAASERRRVEAAQRRSLEVLPPPAPARVRPRRRTLWKGIAWALVAAGAAFGVRILLEKYHWLPATAASAPAPSAAPALQPTMGLRAERQNSDLKLTWNRQSPVIARATSGVLSIEDGNSRRTIPLQAAQVRSGSILYTPVSDQVQMQLTVTTPAGNATESVLVLLTRAGPPQTVAMHPPAPFQPAGTTPASADRDASRFLPAKPFTPPPARPRASASPAPLSEPPALATEANSTAPASAPPWSRPAFSLPPPATPSPPPVPAVASDSRPRSAPAPQPEYHPAEPVREVRPIRPASLVSSAPVEITVAIDAAGNVTKVTPKPQPGVHPLAVSAAAVAALQWKFKPARRGDQPVASEVVLRFTFAPAVPAR
jgi:periplasmic protein TonB